MFFKIAILFFTFISSVWAQTEISSNAKFEAVVSKTSCDKTERAAIVKVDIILEKIVGIPSKYLYTKNVYIRKQRNSRGAFCVEGVVTRAGFKLYDAQLFEQYETIMGDIEDLNDGISYTNKSNEVDRLHRSVIRFNKKLKAAKKLTRMETEYIEETKDSLSKMINAVPVVKFKINGCKGKYKVGCKLVFVSSFKDDSSAVLYRWKFGDGGQSRYKNPVHSYRSSGRYTVSLRITDGGEKFAEIKKNIVIARKPRAKVKYKPQADFSMAKNLYTKNESITFINLSTSKKSKIKRYKWDFGDGGTGTLKSPKHSYSKCGNYKVKLSIMNSDGLSSEVVGEVQVLHPAIIFAIDGRKYNRVVRKFGQPKRSIVKKGVLTQAHLYGSDWLLVKQNKVECRVKGSRFKTNLMGNPKNCHWYEKHAKTALYDVGQ